MAKNGEKTFSTNLPIVLIERLKVAAIISGRPIQELVADALEHSIPRHRVVTDEPVPRRAKVGVQS